ncbi:WG repeat-containing protein [Barnesiella intestinihominis]|uniref:WG repeat-containing protein n=1 Tax=Barnesiella intestinihominis TaxID=487174 RepID=UPI00267403CA|nr:WG repeat-containing protein [Barnesiella intestinihominis]
MKYPISIFLFISMFFVCSCAGLGGFPLYSGSYGSQAASRLTPVENPATGLYSYVNDLGMWVIRPKFRSAQRFRNNGLARVQIGVRYGAINMAGKVVVNPVFEHSYDVDNAITSMEKGRLRGIDLWETRDSKSGLYGYLDYYGNWFIKPQYYNARGFNDEGFAVVEVGRNRWGAIDRNNRIVIQPNFKASYEAENALRRLLGY